MDSSWLSRETEKFSGSSRARIGGRLTNNRPVTVRSRVKSGHSIVVFAGRCTWRLKRTNAGAMLHIKKKRPFEIARTRISSAARAVDCVFAGLAAPVRPMASTARCGSTPKLICKRARRCVGPDRVTRSIARSLQRSVRKRFEANRGPNPALRS